MRKLKRILALLMTLAMLLTATAISEEQIAPAEPEQPAAEAVAEEVEIPEEAIEEEADEEEEAIEEPAEEPEEAPEEPEEMTEESVEAEEFGACKHSWGYDSDYNPTGICVYCGAKCSHKKGSYIYIDEVRQEGAAITALDGLYHIYKADQVEIKVCKACHLEYKKKVKKANITVMEDHIYNDGNIGDVCDVCGYNRAGCKHEHTTVMCDFYGNSARCVPNPDDESTHLVSGNFWVYEYCDDCGACIREDSGYHENIAEAHESDKNGKCKICGYKKKCKHVYAYGPLDDDSYPYCVKDGKNAKTHKVHIDHGAWQQCTLCGYRKEYISTKKSYDQPHVFNGADPYVCTLCGFSKHVEKIELKKKISVYKGSEVTLKPSLTPKYAAADLQWTSSDSNVATVKDGVVHGVEAGVAKITCTATDGSNASASCEVTVNIAKPKGIERIIGLGCNTEQILVYVGETVQLDCIYASDRLPWVQDCVEWSSSNEKFATVDETGLVTALKKNKTVTIKVKARTGIMYTGQTKKCEDTIKIKIVE